MKLASRPALIALAVTVLMVASSFGVIGAGVLSGPSGTSVPQPAPTATPGIAAQAPGAAGAGALSSGKLTMSPFDQRVLETVHALTADGVPTDRIRVPYTGAPAQIVNGVVVPGDAVSGSPVTPYASDAPAPSGIAYYGESDPSGTIQTTTLDAASVVGSLSVNQLKTLYLDTDTPDQWGIQLNSVLTNVTLQGTRGYDFWTQNAVNYIQQNETLSFGEDTWNFSSPYSTVPTDNSTIASHNPNGSVAMGLYIGEGPFLFAPRPFNLTLYLNSSVTPAGDQELWFNYTLSTPGGHRTSANYDWIVFNSTNPSHPATVGIAPFEASGTQLDPAGSPDDFELDYGIGAFDGATNDVLAANASAELDYCPIATASCSSSQFQSVPAAVDYGGETGETSSGLSFTYAGTSETATAGPFTLRGLWGYSGAAGSTPGSTPVVNQITVSGAPDSPTVMPYVFAFFRTSATPDTSFEWAPDVPLWHLAPGTYDYELCSRTTRRKPERSSSASRRPSFRSRCPTTGRSGCTPRSGRSITLRSQASPRPGTAPSPTSTPCSTTPMPVVRRAAAPRAGTSPRYSRPTTTGSSPSSWESFWTARTRTRTSTSRSASPSPPSTRTETTPPTP